MLIFCPAISRGTGLPGSALPFTVTVASVQGTNVLGMWCLPEADSCRAAIQTVAALGARCLWISATTAAPSPMAPPTRLTEPERTSPTATTLVTDTVRVAEAFRRVVMGRFQRLRHRRVFGTATKPYRELFRSELLAGKDAAGRYLAGHDHAHDLPTAEGGDRRRVTHVTVFARRGFDPDAVAALTGLRAVRVGELAVRAQLVGLGRPSDFRARLFGGPDGRGRVWESATPYVGPAHVGRSGRERYLRKAVRRELRRWLSARGIGVDVAVVEALPEAHPAWAGRPRPIEFHRGRSRAGDTGLRRPFGFFRVTLTGPIDGPLSIGYACHYGLGLFLPVEPRPTRPER